MPVDQTAQTTQNMDVVREWAGAASDIGIGTGVVGIAVVHMEHVGTALAAVALFATVMVRLYVMIIRAKRERLALKRERDGYWPNSGTL